MAGVRPYTDDQLLSHCRSLKSFIDFPHNYWILGVQSNEDAYDLFDDKFYLYHAGTFIMVLTGTTNAGSKALLNYKKYNRLGTAIIKTDEWYYGIWRIGLHKKRMVALKQIRPILHYRDGNRNRKSEQSGKLYNKLIGVEFHTATYTGTPGFVRKLIGGWSAGCQVANEIDKYYKVIKLVKSQESVSYCLIKEFEP